MEVVAVLVLLEDLVLNKAEKRGAVVVGELSICKDLTETDPLLGLSGGESGRHNDDSVVPGVQRCVLHCCSKAGTSARFGS